MERTLELQYDEIVIGADLSALLYAYNKKIPIVFTRHIKPSIYVEEELYEKQLSRWESLMFILSFNGFCPLADKCSNIRIDDNILNIVTKNNSMVKIKYNRLVISDDYCVAGLPEPIGKTNKNNLVIDFMAQAQRYDYYTPVVSYKKQQNILFDVNITKKYVLDRKHTLIIAKSNITDDELKQEEYSESYIRLRLLRELYPKVKELKHIKREIITFGKNLYELPNNIKILCESPLEIENLEQKKDEKIEYTEKILWNRL